MTAGRVIDLAVARARLRGGGWDELEAELVEVPDPEPGRLRYFPLPPVTARPVDDDEPPYVSVTTRSSAELAAASAAGWWAKSARPDPRVCGDCGVGGGRHAADCPRWHQAPVAGPVLTLAPALAPLPVQLSIDDSDVS